MAGITVDRELITPSKAKKWLESHNVKNRKLNKRHVEMLASDMGSGRFKLTHEPIAFDETGRLIDGQHRLNAVYQSGRSHEFLVARNLPKGTQLFVDNGRRRSLADAATFEGDLSIDKRKEAVCRSMCDPFLTSNITRMDLLGRYRVHKDAIEWAVEAFKGCPRQVQASCVIAVFARAYYGGEYNRERLEEMARCMRHGELSGPCDRAASKLREYLLMAKSDAKRDRREMIRFASYCAQKFLDRDSRVRSKPGSNDRLGFPLPEERSSAA